MRLHVSAGSPLAEVFLIDHAFALVDRSVGDLHAEVEPGVYTVKATLGEATVERLIVLNSDQDVDLADELPIASPSPIVGTSRTHEYHIQEAVTESAKASIWHGGGAEIFLLTRRWTSGAQDDPALEGRPLSTLSLHRRDGQTVVDLDRPGPGGRDPVAGITVSVEPGDYLLRWRGGWGIAAEQSVQAVRDWQTQLFLLEEGDSTRGDGRHVVSVLMSRQGFRPDDDAVRLVEETRSALAEERKVASRYISESLFAKFENPMLGLFGAHLMLLSKDAEDAPVTFDQGLFDTVVENLRRLLGPGNPDVTALATRSRERHLDALEPITAPPMLWRSWLLLIEASNDSPRLVPVDIWRQTAKLLPLRPFLVWSPADDGGHAAMEWERSIARTLEESSGQGKGPSATHEGRRALSLQLVAPRSAIDEMVGGSL